ncbi:MAG: DUF4093 domain-containing protein, partial [Eubacterium sp.]|nr:DUF4093 domain-containing protein [Eubacterium sp.]
LSRADLMDDGLIGGTGSEPRRKALLRRLGLPERLNTSGLVEVLNRLYTAEEYREALLSLNNKST